jgi:putative DNA primase/helicase
MTEESEPRPPPFTEEALALRFAGRHGADLRYVAAWGKWMIWDGQRWRIDDTLRAFDLARALCREAASVCTDQKLASVLSSARTVAAVVNLARADRRMAATVGQWDADPWLLNTPAGVINLQTGDQRPASPDDFCTHITGAAPAGDCPTWRVFLDRVTGGDLELQLFTQRVVGYSVTGSTREHALFFA